LFTVNAELFVAPSVNEEVPLPPWPPAPAVSKPPGPPLTDWLSVKLPAVLPLTALLMFSLAPAPPAPFCAWPPPPP
jgi:hypothetical protein